MECKMEKVLQKVKNYFSQFNNLMTFTTSEFKVQRSLIYICIASHDICIYCFNDDH